MVAPTKVLQGLPILRTIHPLFYNYLHLPFYFVIDMSYISERPFDVSRLHDHEVSSLEVEFPPSTPFAAKIFRPYLQIVLFLYPWNKSPVGVVDKPLNVQQPKMSVGQR